MKFVEHNGNFQIAPDDVVSYEYLPAGYYKINYDSQHDLFSLDRTYKFEIAESNIYGVSKERIDRVIKAYTFTNKSLGVLLSGDKGIGKTLFAKLLCMSMFAQGKAIIIVDKSYKGLDKFLAEIPGDIVMLFDEFEKTFEKNIDSTGRDIADQESLLTVFDGIGTHKRLFIVTVNNLSDIDPCFLNRTGRFHYHFTFNYPNAEEITQYMHDNLQTYNQDYVDRTIRLSRKIKVNYDTLRSICFEINLGNKWEDFILDMNIKYVEENPKYIFTITDINGKNITLYMAEEYEYTTLFDDGNIIIGLSKNEYAYGSTYKITCDRSNVEFSNNGCIIKGSTYEFSNSLGNDENGFTIDLTKDIHVEVAQNMKILPESVLLN